MFIGAIGGLLNHGRGIGGMADLPHHNAHRRSQYWLLFSVIAIFFVCFMLDEFLPPHTWFLIALGASIVVAGIFIWCRHREPQIHNAVWQRMIAHQLESRRVAAEPEPAAASNIDPLDDPNLTDAQFLELAMAHRERARRMPHIAFVMDYGELMTMPHIGRRPGQTDLQFLSEINAAMALSPFDRARRSSNRRQQSRASRTHGTSAEGLTPRSIARLPTFTLPTPSPKNERKVSATHEQVDSSEEMNSLTSTAPIPVSSQSDQESDRDDAASFESEHQARAYTSAADAVAYLIDAPAATDSNDEYTLAVPTHQSVGSDIGSDISRDTPDKATESAHVCMVCLEDLKGGELVRCLPCMHFFHVDCIDAWLKRKNACPICTNAALPPDLVRSQRSSRSRRGAPQQ